MPSDETTANALEELQSLQTQLTRWRKSTDRGRKIPNDLWNAAAALYPRLSVGKITKALALSHSALSQRIGLKVRQGRRPRANFVEVMMKDPPCRPVETSGIKVEMRDGSGREMLLQLPS